MDVRNRLPSGCRLRPALASVDVGKPTIVSMRSALPVTSICRNSHQQNARFAFLKTPRTCRPSGEKPYTDNLRDVDGLDVRPSGEMSMKFLSLRFTDYAGVGQVISSNGELATAIADSNRHPCWDTRACSGGAIAFAHTRAVYEMCLL
jgi:hypothetical protein